MFPLVLKCPGDSSARRTSSSQEARLSVSSRSGDRGCLTDKALLCNFPVMGSYKFFVGEGQGTCGGHTAPSGWQGLERHVVSASSLCLNPFRILFAVMFSQCRGIYQLTK